MPSRCWMIAALLAIAGCTPVPPEPVGFTLVYEVAAPEGEPTPRVDMAQVVSVLDRRINGNSERKIARLRSLRSNEVEIGVFGKDVEVYRRVQRLVDSIGMIEFRILANDRDHAAIIEPAKELPESQSSVLDEQGRMEASWAPIGDDPGLHVADFEGLIVRTVQRAGRKVDEALVVADDVNLNGSYLTDAILDTDERGRPCLDLRFNSAGAAKLSVLTEANLPDPVTGHERRLGILWDETLILAPTIYARLGQNVRLSGDFQQESQEQLEVMAQMLDSGSLPAKLRPVKSPSPPKEE